MQTTTLKINKIEINNFSPKESTADIKVFFIKNNEQLTIKENFKLKDPYSITKKLLIKIRSIGKFIIENESDDILENIYITQLLKEEETEEQMLYFFKHLTDKLKQLRTKTNAKEYMRLVDQIKTSKLEL